MVEADSRGCMKILDIDRLLVFSRDHYLYWPNNSWRNPGLNQSSMFRTIRILTLFSVLLSLAACKQAPKEADTKRTVVSGIDTSRKPGDDFFSYVNNIWWDSVKIPG